VTAPPRTAAAVTVIIPTFAHPTTLPWAIRSVQHQSVADVAIVVIGDGVTDDTRDAIAPFLSEDSRVSFLDRPKGIRHGESYRHEVIEAAVSPVIGYLGDDDLLFPDHLQTMLGTLEGHDLANPLPLLVRPDGSFHFLPSDLARADSLDWHLDPEVQRNSVSLTGVVHTRESYLRLPHGWRPAPTGRWSDHYMWQQYFALPGFTARTSLRATTAKFAADTRHDLSPVQRAAELAAFWQQLNQHEFRQDWDARVAAGIWDTAVSQLLDLSRLQVLREAGDQQHQAMTDAASLHEQAQVAAAARLQQSLAEAEENLARTAENLAQSQESLARMENSRSWKLTGPLRRLRRLL
jgi:hypothetical protein